jgi:hypothetical protein
LALTENKIQKSDDQLDSLFFSIQQRAFRGELSSTKAHQQLAEAAAG